MAHGLQEHDGMMSGQGIIPWHGLGTVVEGLATSAEAIAAAKLDWQVGMQPVYLADKTKVPQCNAIVRQDTGHILGTAGDSYRPVQNSELFRVVDEVLSDPNGPHLETCGSLHNGRVIWLLAVMPEVLRVAGSDIIKLYILLTNRNTGRRAIEFSQVNVRVVCQNTLTMAEGSSASKLSIRHINSLLDSVDDMRAAIGIVRDNNLKMVEIFNRMVDTPAQEDHVRAVLEKLLPGSELTVKATQTVRDKVHALMVDGQGNKPFAGTWWSTYNGITEWADHHKQLSRGPLTKDSTMTPEETRLWSNWAGPSAAKKSQALSLIIDAMDKQLMGGR